MESKRAAGLRLTALLLCLLMALSLGLPLVKAYAQSLDEDTPAAETAEAAEEESDSEEDTSIPEENPVSAEVPAEDPEEEITETTEPSEEPEEATEPEEALEPSEEPAEEPAEEPSEALPEEPAKAAGETTEKLDKPFARRTLNAESRAFDGTPVTITVSGKLPEDVTLVVKPLTEKEAADDAAEAVETELDILAAFDVKLMQDGTEYEPEQGAVTVTFDGIGQNSIGEPADGEAAPEISVIHIHEDESSVIEDVEVTDETVAIELDQFSRLIIGIPTGDVDQDDEDQFDQANQQYKTFDGGWLSKAFRWTDKENGKGQIILQMELDEAPESRAVYAFTPCTAHGFSQSICNDNINWMLRNYNHVDIIYVTGPNFSDIHILSDVKSTSFTSSITWISDQHWGASLYTGLYEYLMGKSAGSITSASYTGLSDRQRLFPTAIYVSFDLFGADAIGTSSGSNGISGQLSYDCWRILNRYKVQNRYFSSGLGDYGASDGPYFGYRSISSSTLATQKYTLNTLLGLINPRLCPNMSTLNRYASRNQLLTGETIQESTKVLFNTAQYRADYSYGDTFAAQGAPAYIPVTLEDVVVEDFDIVGSVTYKSETSAGVDDTGTGTNLNTFVNDHTMTANFIKYTPGDIVTFTINVEVSDNLDEVRFEQWFDSNLDKAVLTVESNNSRTEQGIDSPIVHLEETSYTATKVWDDFENRDGIRPASPSSLNFVLYKVGQDGELVEMADKYQNPVWDTTGGDTWTVTWNHLPQYTYVDNGQGGQDKVEVVYTCKETAVPNDYEMTQSGDTITNTHVPYNIEVTVTKDWEDNDNADGGRPDSVTVSLLADGKPTGKTLTLTAEGDWQGKFTDLPARAGDRHVIAYGVAETSVDGYRTGVEHDGTFAYKFIVTNTRLAELSGEKTWLDDNDADGARPDSITVHLFREDEELDSKTVTAADGWKWAFAGFDKYDENGEEIVYTVTEDEVALYETVVDGCDITNTYTPGPVSYTVTKVWEDNDDQDRIRTEAVDIQLYADGEALGEPVTLSEENDWTYTWEELESTVDGTRIVYTVAEAEVPEGYEVSVDAQQYSATVTNTHVTETAELTVVKVWEDEDDKDGIRPGSIEIQLYADGKPAGEPVAVSAADQWTYTWTDLDRKQDGQDITYTAAEVNVPDGYEAAVAEEDGTVTITNTHEPEEETPRKHTRRKGVATGDHTAIGVYAALLAVGGAGMAVALKRRKKGEK